MSHKVPSPVTVRQLAAPLIVFAAAIALIVAAGLFWAARRGDAQALLAQTELVQNNLKRQQDRLRTRVSSELIWDEALDNLANKRNLQWADTNVADWFVEAHQVDQVMIVDGDDRPFYFAVDGVRADLAQWQDNQLDVSGILAEIRGAERARGPTPLPPADFSSILSRPIDRVAVVRLPAGAAFLVATLVQSDFGRAQATSARTPVVFSIQRIDAAVIAELEQVLRLESALAEAVRSSDQGRASVPLTDATGREVVWISWRPDRPGTRLLRTSAPFVLLGYGAFLALLAALVARTLRVGALLKASEAQALFLAHHDALTGLANRLAMSNRIDSVLASRPESGAAIAVLCLDLDRFKDINDTFGHAVGDQLLVDLAQRLCAMLPPQATLARLGGDEFAVLMPQVESRQAIEYLAAALLSAVATNVSINAIDHQVSASIGIALTDGPISREELMRRADVALYRAKAAGRARARFHDSEMDAAITLRQTLALELRQALIRGQLEVHYQPQLRCVDRVMVAVEALIRWPHAERGLVPPELLISIAEESGLICDIGDWVLCQALADATRWPDLSVAINVSPEQFKGAGFADRLLELSKQAGVVPRRIELEITESLLLDPSPETERTLRQLRGDGFRLVLDDFGTGYSSLGYLRRFRLDKLKIDRSFVQCAAGDDEGQAILSAVAGIARSLHLEFTAEGVETEEQHAAVLALGCDWVQGFLHFPALNAAQIDTLYGLPSPASPKLTFGDSIAPNV